MDKKGNKENSNGIATDPAKKSSVDGDKIVNAAVNNTIDRLFLMNDVSDHATIQHQSTSDQHSEL